MILVTGGTGFVGREVVAELLRLGYRVRLLARHPEKLGALARLPQVEVIRGDVLNAGTLAAATAGVQAVIHLVGIITETSHVTYDQSHVEATRNLLAAAKGAGVTRWVQMSAIGTRAHARSRYHQTKWQAEELVRASGLDWTILRPSLIYGYDERDRLLNMLRVVLSPPLSVLTLYSFGLINGGTPRIQPVSVREVARCFALAPTKVASIGRTFDLVGPVAFTWREMFFKILDALGKRGVYEDIPLLLALRGLLWLAALALPITLVAGLGLGWFSLAVVELGAGVSILLILAAAMWRTTLVFSLPGEALVLATEPLNAIAPRELRASEVLKMACEDNVGDPSPAMEVFAYTPETFEQGLANCYRSRTTSHSSAEME